MSGQIPSIPQVKRGLIYEKYSLSQGVTFRAGLRVIPAGNLGISKEIQPNCPVGLLKIVSEWGKDIMYLILQVFRWHNI